MMERLSANTLQLEGLIASLPLLLQTTAGQLEAMSVLLRACTHPVENDSDLQGRMALIDALYACATGVEHFAAQCAERVADRVHEYEMKHLRMPDVAPGEVLSVLMKDRGIRQVDLQHIATQSVISDIINGKRAMNVSQIKGLAKFFRVPVDMFIGQQ
ncbi:helix-turn-helix domain-containing protein [Erwinia piriflorinigrans]|uniref:Helix-turn-helix domain-containing protein n=1 Tax=Erwinia piriflorinigrans CFBP 5888 TaxID=1161919 RepID=V5Z9B4_9GAMM|nr:transcriptional regulator [Erwinia piriflorinigrans]CCG87616.1 helix-turn-helix domain-containing protein [Erwinia piriflorinigrans CFBP 5888]